MSRGLRWILAGLLLGLARGTSGQGLPGAIGTPGQIQGPFFAVYNVKSPPSASACAQAKGDGLTDDSGALNCLLGYAGAQGGGVVFLPASTYSICNRLVLANGSIVLQGASVRSTLIKLGNNCRVGVTDPGGQDTALVSFSASNVTMRDIKFDGNKANNAQIVAMISMSGALGAADIRVEDVEIQNGQGNVAYGSCIQMRQVPRVQLANVTCHDNNSDGVDFFGSTAVVVTNYIGYNNGIDGLDIEGSGGRSSYITIHGAYLSNNAANDIGVTQSDHVTLTGITIKAGTTNPAENNCAITIGGSTNVTLQNFVIHGPGNGASPHGICVDDQGVLGASSGIVLGPGVVDSMAGDGLRLSRASSVLGSTGTLIVGVRSRRNTGWGLNDAKPAVDAELHLYDNDFSNNTAGAVNGIESMTRTVLGNIPNDGTYTPLTLYTGVLAMQTDGSLTTSGVFKSSPGSAGALATTKRRVENLVCQAAGLTTSSTSDVSVATCTLEGNSLATNAQAVRVTMRGSAVTQAAVPNIKFGATVLCTGTVTAGNVYELDAIVTRTGATAQLGTCVLDNGTVLGVNTRTTPAETLSGNITIDFRGSVTAGGTLNVDYAHVEYLAQ